MKEVLEKAKSTKTPAQNNQLIKLCNQNICFSSLRGCEITPKINIFTLNRCLTDFLKKICFGFRKQVKMGKNISKRIKTSFLLLSKVKFYHHPMKKPKGVKFGSFSKKILKTKKL